MTGEKKEIQHVKRVDDSRIKTDGYPLVTALALIFSIWLLITAVEKAVTKIERALDRETQAVQEQTLAIQEQTRQLVALCSKAPDPR